MSPEPTTSTAPVPTPSTRSRGRVPLAAWPLAWLFAGVPLWWVTGLIDVIVVPIAVVMLFYLRRTGGIRVPRGFAVWLLFLAFMLGSIIQLMQLLPYLTFGYRAGIYLASTVVFLYAYNARPWISDRRILGYLAYYFAFMVAGGFLGAVAPVGRLRTPMYYVLANQTPSLVTNELVNVMVVRPFAQYSPTGYFQVPPRPAAPFLYTNNWGNAYSLLLPLMVVLLFQTPRRTWQRRVLMVLIPLSAIPATLTLNRGMFIGLAIVAVLVGFRLALNGYLARILLVAGVVAVIGVVLWNVFNVSAGLETRTEASTNTRASLYSQSLTAASASPLFGYGNTIPSTSSNPYDPQVGTQGQFWMVLVSHGVIAVTCFVGFFLVVFLMTLRRRDIPGITYNAVVLAGAVETFYYGLVPYGLPLLMVAAALALRPPPSPRRRLARLEPRGSHEVGVGQRVGIDRHDE